MSELYLGMISGTSVDGTDAVIVAITAEGCRIVRGLTTPYTAALRARVQSLIASPTITLKEYGSLDTALGLFFAESALSVITAAGLEPRAIAAIGHHGQTVHHDPVGAEPFTLQIGDPNIVAARTGIATVADFRRLDIAYGGQGAPLVPAFHEAIFDTESEIRVVLNLGGIANITVLDHRRPVTGFDTGPGNTLLDLWILECRGARFDADGEWAGGGCVADDLLAAMLDEPYFAKAPPKSTGRELFNLDWLERKLKAAGRAIDARDIPATLAELTACTVARAIDSATHRCDRIIVCGGGAHNGDLLRRLARLTGNKVETSDAWGLAADWVEGAAFAWMAHARMSGKPSNMPSVTGAREHVTLGSVYCPVTEQRTSRPSEPYVRSRGSKSR